MEGKYVFLLLVVLVIYLCLGAALFQWTEKSAEKKTKEETFIKYEQFLDDNTCVSQEELNNLLEAVVSTSATYGGFSAVKKSRNSTVVIWDFTGAFTFAMTVVTTIGYGYTHPATSWGKLICIVYALFGIPLALLVLSGIGDKLSLLRSKVHRLELNPDSPAANKWINMTLLVGGGLLVMFVIPSAVFTSLEDWDIIESVYYCFVTLSTIGFGDYVAGIAPNNEEPFRTIYRIAVYVWIFLGLSYLSLVIQSLSKILVKRAKKVQEKALERVNTENFPFKNGARIINGVSNISKKRTSSQGSGEGDGEDEPNGDVTETSVPSNITNTAPLSKHKGGSQGVATGGNNGNIQLISVSNIEPRY